MIILIKKLLISISFLIVIGAISYGVIYLSGQENKASSNFKDSRKALEESHKKVSPEIQAIIASEEKRLESERIKLDDLKKQFNLHTSTEIALRDEISQISDKVLKGSEILFVDQNMSDPSLKTKVTNDITKNISDKKQKVLELLQKIETVGKAESRDIATIQDYIDELKTLVDDMTVQNSGLNQTEINREKAVVSSLEKEVGKSFQNISEIGQVARQEEVIQGIMDHMDVLNNTVSESPERVVNNNDSVQDDIWSGTREENPNSVDFPGYSYEANVFEDDSANRDVIPVKYFPIKKTVNSEGPDILQGSDL